METLLLMTFLSLAVSHMKVNDCHTNITYQFSHLFLLILCFPQFSVLGKLPTNTTIIDLTTSAPTVPPHICPDGEFACGTHWTCVPMSKVCDFRYDCSDGSDEMNCGKIFP